MNSIEAQERRQRSCRNFRPDALVIRIHHEVLKQSEGAYALKVDLKPQEVHDEVAIELAYGLFEANSFPQMGEDTILYMVGMLCSRLASSSRDLDGEGSGAQHFEDWQAKEIERSVRLAIEQDASTDGIANRCGLSVCHFSRLFKATYGLPLHKYVVGKRIKRAQERLKSTEDAIAEIALDCGFADQSSFTRRFTAVVGVSPYAWRKRSGPKLAAFASLGERPEPSQETAANVEYV